MPTHKNSFHNKIDFSREEFAAELCKRPGILRHRQRKSIKGEYTKFDFTHKTLKRQRHEKLGQQE